VFHARMDGHAGRCSRRRAIRGNGCCRGRGAVAIHRDIEGCDGGRGERQRQETERGALALLGVTRLSIVARSAREKDPGAGRTPRGAAATLDAVVADIV
jgi:hypothetical protein